MDIVIDTWLYGELARYGGDPDQHSFTTVKVTLTEGSTVKDLLDKLGMPTQERGITFINGDLSAMPNVQPDLDHKLTNGDRVAFFHLRSMWPYQYRSGAAMTSEFSGALNADSDKSVHHSAE